MMRIKRTAIVPMILSSAMVLSALGGTVLGASVTASSSYDTVFTFSDNGITASGSESGYKIENNQLTIQSAGNYCVTGSCSDGQVKVKKSVTGVKLTLSDLSLKCTDSAPVVCNKSTQAVIIIDGTVSLEDTINNNDEYVLAQDSSAETDDVENAVMKFKGNSKILLTGSGTLNITAKAKNGIKSGAVLDSDEDTELAGDSSAAYLITEGITLNVDATDVYQPDSDTYGDGINAERYL